MSTPDRQFESARPVAGLVGTFDIANFGDLLLPAVAERELVHRVPDLVVRRFSPFGWDHPVPMDGGELAEPLDEPTLQRRAAVADACDTLIIGGGEILHFADDLLAPHYGVDPSEAVRRAPSTWFVDGTGADALVPTAWNAVGIPMDFDDAQAAVVQAAAQRHRYLAVRDDESRKRLEMVGVDRDIAVVPDPGFLVTRLFDRAVVDRRRRLHATLGWTPPGRYICVQGNGSMLNEVDRISTALDAVLADRADVDILLLETGHGHGDIEFANAFRARHPGRVWQPSASLLLVDFAAILAACEAFVGVSLHAAITATAFGRRAVVFNAPRQSKHRGLVSHLGDRTGYIETADDLPVALRWALGALGPDPALRTITRQIDAHFDRLAALVDESWGLRTGIVTDERSNVRLARLSAELTAARTAHAVRGRRLLAERDELGALLDREVRRNVELESAVARLTIDDAAALQRADRLEGELRSAVDRADVAEHALAELYATRTFRWLRLPRRIYAWLRR